MNGGEVQVAGGADARVTRYNEAVNVARSFETAPFQHEDSLPDHAAYRQIEAALTGGLTWLGADEMIPLAATWRDLIHPFSEM